MTYMITADRLMRRHAANEETPNAGLLTGSHNRRVVAMLKKIVALLLALLFVPGLALLGGCNTVGGAGQDISKAGQKVEKEAAEHKTY